MVLLQAALVLFRRFCTYAHGFEVRAQLLKFELGLLQQTVSLM